MYDLLIFDLLFHDWRFTIHALHSLLKLFTEFAIAAFIDWKLAVIHVIIRAPVNVAAKIHHDKLIRHNATAIPTASPVIFIKEEVLFFNKFLTAILK